MSVRLEVDRLTARYGEVDGPEPAALAGVSLAAEPGSLVAIVGASGSGKSTLLRCVAGLMTPAAGEVRIDGRRVTGVPPGLAVVFQDYGRSLFPWMSVRENVELPLRHERLPAGARRERADAALAEVGLPTAGDRYPWQLSGGMQQRVAFARAMASRPSLLLLDEPFGSVDAQTRGELQDLALALWQAHESTVVVVTHDIDESVYLADRVLVLAHPPRGIVADVPVPLPRPRDQVETRSSDGFVTRRAEIARLLRRP